jgi:ABC-type multidrug transport system fused ATPase/permease subunit
VRRQEYPLHAAYKLLPLDESLANVDRVMQERLRQSQLFEKKTVLAVAHDM